MFQFTRYSFLILILSISSLVNSQNFRLGITGSFGLSKLDLERPGVKNLPDNWKYKYRASGNGGLFGERKITDRSSIGIEVLWVQIEGLESIENEPIISSSGYERGIGTDKTYRHISYIGLPLYYRIGFGKFGIKAGGQLLILAGQSADYEMSGQLDGQPYYYKGDYEDLGYNQFDWGAKTGLDFRLNDRFSIRADYYYGFKSIIPYWLATLRRNRQASLGVSYTIYSTRS